MLLKPNMVISGKKCTKQASVQEVAEATVRCLTRYVPAAVPLTWPYTLLDALLFWGASCADILLREARIESNV